MKNHLVKLLFIALFSVFIVGCEKEDPEITAEMEIEQGIEGLKAKQQQSDDGDGGPVDVTHTYSYQGTTFSVTYTLSEANGEIIAASGDVDMAESVFANDHGGKELFFENPVEGSKNIAVRVFDTESEMSLYAENTLGRPQEVSTDSDQENRSCSSYNNWGYGSYFFYKHAYYNTEMTSLRRTNTRRTGNHWVGSPNNDQMSSAIMGVRYGYRSYLSLKQHICYGGRSLNFYVINYSYSPQAYYGIRNLSWYTLSWRWFRRISWNDQVSSYKGWHWQ